jgi:hypothetical protein
MSSRTLPLVCAFLILSACATGTSPPPGPGPADADSVGPGEEPPTNPPPTKPPTGSPDASVSNPKPEPTPDSGAPAAPDARAQADAGAPVSADAGPPPAEGEYTCTLVIGINATAEWYNQGFEKLVDGARWELIRVHSGFIQLWADPKDGVWSTGMSSACAQNANNPDRVIFVALQFDYTTLDQWLPPLQATVKNLQAKYTNAKRIELATFVRAPGNKPCPQAPAKRSTIAAAEDEAIAMVVAANPGQLVVSPKFEAATCGEFSGNPPHPTAAGGMAWAKRIAEHYGLGK